jgi:hypothetical protein
MGVYDLTFFPLVVTRDLSAVMRGAPPVLSDALARNQLETSYGRLVLGNSARGFPAGREVVGIRALPARLARPIASRAGNFPGCGRGNKYR